MPVPLETYAFDYLLSLVELHPIYVVLLSLVVNKYLYTLCSKKIQTFITDRLKKKFAKKTH